jgi:hypothetical protein
MEWINKDILKEFVCGIFTNLVRIQDSQNSTVMSSLFLCKPYLINTMMNWLAINCTIRNWAFVATTAHTTSIYDITMLGLVSQVACFVWPSGTGSPS